MEHPKTKKLIVEKTDKELYDFCKSRYYEDIKSGELRNPWEWHKKESIEEYIHEDIIALRSFLGMKEGFFNCAGCFKTFKDSEAAFLGGAQCKKCFKENRLYGVIQDG